MPKKLSTITGLVFGASLAVYVALVIFTVSLASFQTELQSSVGDAEAAVGTLESKYYADVATVTTEDPSTLGLVAPRHTAYARGTVVPTLTAAF